MDADGRTPVILVMCDDAPSAEALVTQITKRLRDIVYAANKSEALRQLAQCPLDAAVLARSGGHRCLSGSVGI
jgi:CheY-like chemotaxis protein